MYLTRRKYKQKKRLVTADTTARKPVHQKQTQQRYKYAKVKQKTTVKPVSSFKKPPPHCACWIIWRKQKHQVDDMMKDPLDCGDRGWQTRRGQHVWNTITDKKFAVSTLIGTTPPPSVKEHQRETEPNRTTRKTHQNRTWWKQGKYLINPVSCAFVLLLYPQNSSYKVRPDDYRNCNGWLF